MLCALSVERVLVQSGMLISVNTLEIHVSLFLDNYRGKTH